MSEMTEEFKNGLTAGIVLAAAHLLREGYQNVAEDIVKAAGIHADEELSFCSDYDLRALRKHWPEFADCYGNDFVPGFSDAPANPFEIPLHTEQPS